MLSAKPSSEPFLGLPPQRQPPRGWALTWSAAVLEARGAERGALLLCPAQCHDEHPMTAPPHRRPCSLRSTVAQNLPVLWHPDLLGHLAASVHEACHWLRPPSVLGGGQGLCLQWPCPPQRGPQTPKPLSLPLTAPGLAQHRPHWPIATRDGWPRTPDNLRLPLT